MLRARTLFGDSILATFPLLLAIPPLNALLRRRHASELRCQAQCSAPSDYASLPRTDTRHIRGGLSVKRAQVTNMVNHCCDEDLRMQTHVLRDPAETTFTAIAVATGVEEVRTSAI